MTGSLRLVSAAAPTTPVSLASQSSEGAQQRATAIRKEPCMEHRVVLFLYNIFGSKQTKTQRKNKARE